MLAASIMKHLLASALLISPLAAETAFDRLPDISDSAADPLVAPFAYGGVTFGSSEVESSGVDFDFQQYRLYAPLTPKGIAIGPATTLYFEADYTLTDFSVEASIADVDALHRLNIPITFFHDQKGTPWSFFATVAPEIATDFNNVNGDSFGVNGALAARYVFNDNLSGYLGAAYTRSLGDPGLFPLVGLDWRISDDTALQISGSTVTLSHRLCAKSILRLGTYASGGYWNVKNANQDFDLGFVSHNVGAGIDYALTDSIWLSIRGGLTIGQELSIESPGGGNRLEGDLENGWFGYVGLRVYEW